MTQQYCLFDTAIGTCALAWSAAGVTRVRLPHAESAVTEQRLRRLTGQDAASPAPPVIAHAIELLQRYGSGEAIDFRDVVLDFAGISDFNGQIYRALSAVPWGETTTYGTLAQTIGAPGAARAVGVAMSRNPWPIVIPCHRVLATNRMGGFSAPGGTRTKDRLLALEGAHLRGETPLLPGLFGPD